MIFEAFEPKAVFRHFEAISKIPRGSGNEKAVSDYILEFAKGLGLRAVQDSFNNLVIYKPASPDCDDSPPVILQAHLDMVCEKNAGTEHDFTKDPIDIYVDGDFIKARGTTLGADNGIGVAVCMALLEENLAHPPLEIVLTTDEEAGMGGAENLDVSLLKGRLMLNLDSADDSVFLMGSAAGSTVEFSLPADWTNPEPGSAFLAVSVKGLKGGHSGMDIDKCRGSALRILGHLLGSVNNTAEIKISQLSGGMKINAIPREASAAVFLPREGLERARAALEKCRGDMLERFGTADPGLEISWDVVKPDGGERVLTAEKSKNVIASLLLIPEGVQAMSADIPGLVNGSCNLGVAEVSDDFVKFLLMPRGGAGLYIRQIESRIKTLAGLVGGHVTCKQRSSAWPYNPNSAFKQAASGVYKSVFGREPKTTAMHIGLECGLFAEKIPGLDIIAFGATAYDFHTPDERVSISSVGRVWEFVKKMLENRGQRLEVRG